MTTDDPKDISTSELLTISHAAKSNRGVTVKYAFDNLFTILSLVMELLRGV